MTLKEVSFNIKRSGELVTRYVRCYTTRKSSINKVGLVVHDEIPEVCPNTTLWIVEVEFYKTKWGERHKYSISDALLTELAKKAKVWEVTFNGTIFKITTR